MTSERIKARANEIREKIQREGAIATIYGEPFDPNDPDCVLVAAVVMTESKERQKALKDIRLLKALERGH